MHGYWLKGFTSLYDIITIKLNAHVISGEVSPWMTKERTCLIVKDESKGALVSNFRPITCLRIMWKLLTGIIGAELYNHLEGKKLLPEEQKGCRRKSRGTKDQLMIDKMILKNCKRKLTNLNLAWIGYKKAYDMVPHSWIIECLEIFKVSQNITILIRNSMKNWRVELTSMGQKLGEVNIRRGIFQGDSLSPILFVMALIP